MFQRLLESTRRKVFWLRDSLNNNSVGSNLKEIALCLETKNTNESQKLKDLLETASENCAFYASYKNGPLQDFPVINKNMIKEKWSQFLNKTYDEKNLIPAITSGSTGTPFKVLQDSSKKNRNTADTIYFSRLGGYFVGNRLFYLKIWAKDKMASSLSYWIQNVIPQDVIKLDKLEIKNLLSKVESYKGNASLLGYVSAFTEVCKYLDAQNAKANKYQASSIITISEGLDSYTAETMEKYFGKRVFSRYSNLENGIIAQQVPDSDQRFLINSASYVIEILKLNKDEEVEKGEAGRIVITDLYNLAFPMIRYDTGDVGSFGAEDELGNSYLENIEGRKLDLLFNTKGEIISSYIAYKNMHKYLEIDQYQLIQERLDKFTFKISMSGNKTLKQEAQLVKEFKEILGMDSIFDVEYVDEIPLLNSGKRRKLVNLMNTNHAN